MVIDTSALVAIVQGEPSAERLVAATTGRATQVSAATLVEALIIIDARHGADGVRDLELLLDLLGAAVTPVDHAQAVAAHAAWARFGKGRHPAALNFGDCFAYALAQRDVQPLLFVGDDFTQTDVASALD